MIYKIERYERGEWTVVARTPVHGVGGTEFYVSLTFSGVVKTPQGPMQITDNGSYRIAADTLEQAFDAIPGIVEAQKPLADKRMEAKVKETFGPKILVPR